MRTSSARPVMATIARSILVEFHRRCDHADIRDAPEVLADIMNEYGLAVVNVVRADQMRAQDLVSDFIALREQQMKSQNEILN